MEAESIILIGLGPGSPDLVTRAAWNRLEVAARIFTPAPAHPALAHLPRSRIHPIPTHDPASWAMFLKRQAAMGEAVVCALPGHPCEHPLWEVLFHEQQFEIQQVEIIAGLSLQTCFRDALVQSGQTQIQGMQYLNAPIAIQAMREYGDKGGEDARAWCEMQRVGTYEPPHLPFPWVPTRPALLTFSPMMMPVMHETANDGIPSPDTLSHLIQLRYPPSHTIQVIHLDLDGKLKETSTTTLHNLLTERKTETTQMVGDWAPTESVAWFIAPLEALANRRSFEGLQWVVARLLGPNGCPWDREQTFQSLRAGLLEETYEVLEALDLQDVGMLTEELGDVLLQVALYSEMGRQARSFTGEDILEHLTSKLIRRHPHVFGSVEVRDSQEVLSNWEQIKSSELQQKGRARTSVLDGIPIALPALATTQKLLVKAIKEGFNWEEIESVLGKLDEELQELHEALHDYNHEKSTPNYAHLVEELGDVMFMVVHVGTWFGVDAESALRESNHKFRIRFGYIEQAIRARGCTLADLSDEQIQVLWCEAKHYQRQSQKS